MSKKNLSSTCVTRYKSIEDLPLYNWIKCERGNYQFVRLNPFEVTEADEQDIENWIELYDQYIKKYGLGKAYKRLLDVQRRKAILELDYVITKDAFKLTEIEIEIVNLQNMIKNRGSGMTIDESLIYLSKFMGYRLNPKEITVIEYYTLLDHYGKANQTQ